MYSNVVFRHDVFLYFLLEQYGKSFCHACLPSTFGKIIGTSFTTESAVIVIWSLTSIMKDQTVDTMTQRSIMTQSVT